MRRVIDLLAPLGAVVILGATLWQVAGKTLPGREAYYLAAGAALILTHLVLRWDDVLGMVGRRQMKYGANAMVQVLVVLGVLGSLYWLARKYDKRLDLTKSKRHSLSEQTRKVLGGLKDDVTIWYFQREAGQAEGRDRLELYRSASSRVKLNFVDPVAKPAQARAFEITAVPTLVIERGARREKISNDSEQDLTNALIKITREAKRTVCFVEGEGERDIEESGDRGLSAVKGALSKSQYETRKLLLLREGKVPEDCSVVVLAGPSKDPRPEVVDVLRGHLKGGGKALVMLEPEFNEGYPNLTGLLKEFNVEAGKDVVLDVSLQSQLAGTGPETPLAARYPLHEITKDFRLATAFHTARSVKAATGSPAATAQNLVETSPDSWAEADYSSKGSMGYDEGKDTRGPVSLGAVATIPVAGPSPSPSPSASPSDGASPAPSPSPEEGPKREGRLVVVGDSDFASNAFLGFPGNQDFVLNAIAWLAQDVDLISIRPREADDQRLFLSRQQQQLINVVAMLVIPGVFVVLGIALWWRRRG